MKCSDDVFDVADECEGSGSYRGGGRVVVEIEHRHLGGAHTTWASMRET